MVGKTCWPALKSCKHQDYEPIDRLTELPDDLLLLIMSFLTMKEVASTSVLSHRWNHLWRCFTVLTFKDYPARKRTFTDYETFPQERSNFLGWVNQLLDAHRGPSIDEFKVIFDLDKSCQPDVDRWVDFALTKQVKSLVLDFTEFFGRCNPPFKWRPKSVARHHLPVFKSCLRSLCLKSVNVTSKGIDCLLRSCMVLEDFCIESSRSLRHVIAFDSPLQLKHFEVFYCPRLRTIDILAPKLLSFAHYGKPIGLHIRNASLLSKVSFGDATLSRDILAYATESLSKYFSQLEYLSWEIRLNTYSLLGNDQYNLGIKNPPAMTNLKHLQLNMSTSREQSLFGWVDLIEASPLLQRVTVKIIAYDRYERKPPRKIMRRNGPSLKSLKTLELCGDIGYPIDLEFATYVFENSIMLKDVIMEIRSRPIFSCGGVSVDDRIANIKRIVPQGVNLTLKVVDYLYSVF